MFNGDTVSEVDLNTIRLEAKDPDTGPYSCAAVLHYTIKYARAHAYPALAVGSTLEYNMDIEYKIEKTTYGRLYATVQRLD